MLTQNPWFRRKTPILKKTCLFALGFIFFSSLAQRLPNTPPFDVNELQKVNHRITPEQARALKGRYSTGRGSWSKKTMPLSEAFNKRQLDSLLSQPGCMGMRICFGMDDKGQVRLILYGINDKGKDIGSIDSKIQGNLARNSKQKGSDENYFTDEIVLESGQRCPQYCPN